MNETVITLFGTIDRYWYNKNYLKYFLDKAKYNRQNEMRAV